MLLYYNASLYVCKVVCMKLYVYLYRYINDITNCHGKTDPHPQIHYVHKI